MLVDIPDAGIILVSVLAFLCGLVTLYLYTKIRSPGSPEKVATTNSDRIDYYERELIDMKIRLDSMDLDGESFTSAELPKKRVKSLEKPEIEKQEFVDSKTYHISTSSEHELRRFACSCIEINHKQTNDIT